MEIIRTRGGDVVYVRYIEAPMVWHALTVLDRDGCFNMYVNQDMDKAAEERTVWNELDHIENGDFYSDHSGSLIEQLQKFRKGE